MDRALSLCPTDEPPSSLNSPASNLSPSTARKKSGREDEAQIDSSTFRFQSSFKWDLKYLEYLPHSNLDPPTENNPENEQWRLYQS